MTYYSGAVYTLWTRAGLARHLARAVDLCGVIGIHDNGPRRDGGRHLRLHLAVFATSRAYLETLAKTLGVGTVRPRHGGKGWEWRVYADQAWAVLRGIQPYLSVKAGQALLGMAFQSLGGRRGRAKPDPERDRRRQELYRKCYALNREVAR